MIVFLFGQTAAYSVVPSAPVTSPTIWRDAITMKCDFEINFLHLVTFSKAHKSFRHSCGIRMSIRSSSANNASAHSSATIRHSL
jgi:hypothetical protein